MAEYLDIMMFVAALILLLRGFPVAFTLAGVALVFAFLGAYFEVGYFTGDISFLKTYPNRIFGNYDETNEVLVAVPLFIFMGVMLERSQVAGELLETMGRLFGPLRGGLGLSVSFVGMLLAASTGIVGATVVTMGLISLPSMLKHNYSKQLACGSIAAAGTLGQIIPPSIVLVILGDQISNAYIDARRSVGDWAPEPVSVGDLFAGALIPGLILVGLYMTYQIGMAILRPESSPSIQEEGADSAEHRRAVLWILGGFAAMIVAASLLPPMVTLGLIAAGLFVLLVLELIGLSPFAEDRRGFAAELIQALAPPVILIVAVLGSILAGIATPTEAAAVGAVGATLLAGSRVKTDADDTGDLMIVAIVGTIAAMLFGRLSGAVDSSGAVMIGAGGLALLVLLHFARDKTTLILMAVIGLIVAMILQQQYDLRLTRTEISGPERIAINLAWGCLALAALGVLAALIRVWRAGVLHNVMQSTTKVTTMVFIILVGAGLFSLVFRGLGGEERVHEWLSDLPGGAFGAMLVVMLVMFVLGFFLDFLEIVFVVVPIVAPILFQLELPGGGHMSPVWVAVMMAINLQTSFLTPPFGFALFYLRGVAPKEITTMDIYKGVAPFVLIQILGLAIIWHFPILATWLPKAIFG